jgi:hypothetical protein
MICHRVEDPFEELAAVNPKALLADGLEDAYLGYVINTHHRSVAVYDAIKCVEVLMRDGMTEEEAEEYLEFNTFTAYVGENGPLFVRGN